MFIPLFGAPSASTLLDRISERPPGAYSNRKLKQSYLGAAIRVINIDTSVQTDLPTGFNKANADALGAVNKIEIVKIYDQSGNGMDISFSNSGAMRPRLAYLNCPMWDFSATTGAVKGETSGSLVPALNIANPKLFYVIDPRYGSAWINTIQTPGAGKFRFNNVLTGGQLTQIGEYNDLPIQYDVQAVDLYPALHRGTRQFSSYFQPGTDGARVNAVDLVNSSGTPDTGGAAIADGILWFGDIAGAGLPFRGRIAEFLLFSGAVSNASRDIIEQSQIAYGQSGNRFVTHGDSIARGSGLSGGEPDEDDFSIGAQVRDLLGDGWDCFNRGWGGASLDNISSASNLLLQAPIVVDPLLITPTKKNILIIWDGFNDLQTRTPATFEANLITYTLARKAAGWKIIWIPLPNSNASGAVASYAADRLTVNSWMSANWHLYADGYADITGDAHIGDGSDTTNTTYYAADQLHLKAPAYAIAAPIIYAIANAL